MPQAVVLGTKRDRGLNCRGATLRGPGEQRSYARRRKKKFSGFPHTPLPLPPSTTPPLQHPSTSNHQQRALTTNHDTRVHTQSSPATGARSEVFFWRCLSASFSPSVSLSSANSGPCPAPQSAQDHIWSTAAQGTQSLPMNTRTVARTNNKDPEGGSLIYPNVQCFSAFPLLWRTSSQGNRTETSSNCLNFFTLQKQTVVTAINR